ncbi:MAG: hypothetical protein DRI95_15010 [Bacteroidetes bacterium]|nr:MAG: hypothetical protein DRI95_15010 [Bacteroidota bacterium]
MEIKIIGHLNKYSKLIKLYEELTEEKVYHGVKFNGKTLTIVGLNKFQADQVTDLFNNWEKQDFENEEKGVISEIKKIESEMYLQMKEDRTNRCCECNNEIPEKETNEFHGFCKVCFSRE